MRYFSTNRSAASGVIYATSISGVTSAALIDIHLGLEGSGISNETLQSLRAELWLNRIVLISVNVDDVPRKVGVDLLIAFIQYHKEQIETTHDRSAHLQVRSETLLSVVPSTDRIGRGEDRRASIEGGLDTCFGDGNGLLFHCFVDCDLVGDVHLVKFVDRADSIVRKHESTCFNREVSCLFILHDSSRETSSRRRLP